ENEPNLKNSYLKRSAFKSYFELVNTMYAYENSLFEQYCSEATYIVNVVMRKNILTIQICNKDTLLYISDALETIKLKRGKSMEAVDNAPTVEQLSHETPTGFIRKVTKFTSISTMIQWLVGLKPNEKDKFCIKQCELLVKASTQEGLPTWRHLVGERILIEYEMQFTVNLKRDIFKVMFEGQQFEHFGFQLPSVLRTAIMKKEMLFNDFEAVSEVINNYNSLLNKLSLSEVNFLRDHLYETEVAVQVGVGRYTWQSFNITKYCSGVNALMRKLQSIVNQINYIRLDIRKRIDQIKTFNIFVIEEIEENYAKGTESEMADVLQQSSSVATEDNKVKIIRLQESSESILSSKRECGTGIYHCQGYMERLEQTRTEKCTYMKKIYDSLGPVLIKLESLVLGTYTGRSEKMREYYIFWEEETYKCIL
ncbi:hypothetical protein DOY81_013722, partial [Sarcophaga bullata]